MIKAIFEVSRLALIAMTPMAIFFAACYLYRWRHGKRNKPQMVAITRGKPDREWREGKMTEFKDLEGKILVNIENRNDEQLIFTLESGEKYCLHHKQDCCESVTIEEIIGDLKDLVGNPITQAEEVTHENENPKEVKVPTFQDSFTWTFYKLATQKGFVTIRWYGESNGYYSESVSFSHMDCL